MLDPLFSFVDPFVDLIDIVMSLLRPDELEKRQQHIASYLAKHGSSEI